MVYYRMQLEHKKDEFCDDCEGFNPGEFCDCEPIEKEDIDHGDPHEIDDYYAEMSALQEMNRVGPDYWRNDAGEWCCG